MPDALLCTLEDEGLITVLDRHFGAFVAGHCGLDAQEAALVGAAAAVVSAQLQHGHSCISLSLIAQILRPHAGPLPIAALRALLAKSPAVTREAGSAPLTLDAADRLALTRHCRAEARIAGAIGRLVRAGDGAIPLPDRLLAALFPPNDPDPERRQARAAMAAFANRFTVVSGGPGTGKTSTVVKILALLLDQRPGLEIGLAAPTGKAAARLSESIRGAIDALPIPAALAAAIPRQVATLHRLLGYRPGDGSLRHDHRHRLPYDVVVVDEASMVDLLLMDALLAALPDHGRLILVGDSRQLASVETGYVLADLCRTGALADQVVELRYNHRFKPGTAISDLAAAIADGRSDQVLRLLDAGHAGIGRIEPSALSGALDELVLPACRAVLAAGSAAEALTAMGRQRVLCALRRGPYGVEALTAGIERRLGSRRPGSLAYYAGMPIMVSANDYALRLFNGDLGVVWPDAQGALLVHFPDPGGQGLRPVAPSRLVEHQTAWALTVHKAQGSEFDEALVVLGEDSDSPLLSRELLYTAITRVRTQVRIVASREVLARAVAAPTARESGLAAQLAEALGAPKGTVENPLINNAAR